MGKNKNKSLKKLSRIELLEVMVGLSEDRERLAVENARLKKMLAAQRLPRSAKVGSIAQAALQANGYFEAAQRSADEYLREIKHLRDELAVRAGASDRFVASASAAPPTSRASDQMIIKDAQKRANQIVAHANAQAEAMIADARTRCDEAIANAHRQSHAILSQARRHADATVAPVRASVPTASTAGLTASAADASRRGRHARAAAGGGAS